MVFVKTSFSTLGHEAGKLLHDIVIIGKDAGSTKIIRLCLHPWGRGSFTKVSPYKSYNTVVKYCIDTIFIFPNMPTGLFQHYLIN